ncbi:MAG: cytochrome c [Chitinophagaceae bacterium]|nr:MAG: cytochrome c [Chitinophagaceae bacterium]
MKRSINFLAIAVTAIIVTLSSCGGKRSPGAVYMPDMAYSRTYEAYDLLDSTKFTGNVNDKGGNKIFFNAKPATGTIKRGDLFPYTLTNDSIGYKASGAVVNPIGDLSPADLAEAGRLYNINCGVCHGAKGKANGPMAGKVGGIVDLTLDQFKALGDGTIFHVMTYGKNNMGSYASQLTKEQRWKVVKYVRTLQGVGAGAKDSTGAKTTAPAAGMDSTATAKK